LHVTLHDFAAQRATPLVGASQACPQVSQFKVSVAVSTQLPPHGVYPSSQRKPQVEALQVAVACSGIGQAMPQSPQ
jgi:hypothetical protein